MLRMAARVALQHGNQLCGIANNCWHSGMKNEKKHHTTLRGNCAHEDLPRAGMGAGEGTVDISGAGVLLFSRVRAGKMAWPGVNNSSNKHAASLSWHGRRACIAVITLWHQHQQHGSAGGSFRRAFINKQRVMARCGSSKHSVKIDDMAVTDAMPALPFMTIA